MTKRASMIFGSIATASLLMGTTVPALAENASETQTAANGQTNEIAKQTMGIRNTTVQADAAFGEFSWSQEAVTPTEAIHDVFAKATNGLCQATDDFIVDNPLAWELSVTGDVENAYTATVSELANEEAVKQTMTCSCGGNPADGAAIITADVKGIPVTHLVERAGVSKKANTITFASSDGTEVAMPLAYAIGRHAVISFELNGEDLSASVGGNNQLWMTKTPANYFLRDITEVRVTCENEVPVNPGAGMDYPNSPNVGIQSASAA